MAECSGETIVIDTANMIYTASSPDYSMDGTLGDEGEGIGALSLRQ